MSVRIRRVQIQNFRSIHSLDADLADLSIFVGKNDAGKSNILRALNLFFNDETNPGADFSFEEDYNFHAPVRNRKAKEVRVQIELEIPDTYHRTNGEVIVWSKRWRAEGLFGGDTDYYGLRVKRHRRGGETRTKVEIPDKSNVHALLRKIEFDYVPAIKDAEFFAELRGRIYGIISDVAAKTFHDSSTAFEQSIGDHLRDLTSSISKSLQFETRLALPRDLSQVFEQLDFLSGNKAVSLDNRGDGIKARHIPLILSFMAQKKASLQVRGGMPISNIWAYEEPENNLEFASAVQLADELLQYAYEGTAQVLLTTHSPAFYDLGLRNEDVALHHIVRKSDDEGTSIEAEPEDIDESLGTLAMLRPRISALVDQVRNQENAKNEAQRLAEANKSKIFVEGESDRIVLTKAIEVFHPNALDQVDVETKPSGAGHNYVIDMLVGWRVQHKHHPKRPRSAGIVDGDAFEPHLAFNKNSENIKSAKSFVYPKPTWIRRALELGYKLPVTLELLYPRSYWEWALQHGRLERRSGKNVLPADLIDRILLGEISFDEVAEDEWRIFVEYDFVSDSKITMARRVASDQNPSEALNAFRPLIKNVLLFLGLIQDIDA